jgi:hypothetical protein
MELDGKRACIVTRLPIPLLVVCTALQAAGCDAPEVAYDYDVNDLPDLELSEELRVGSVDDPDYGFSRIGAIHVDAAGNVYLVETAAREVRVYSPTGELLHRLGRPGDGPGEFASPPTSIGTRGDTVWVGDRRPGRITMFDPRGPVLATVSLPRSISLEGLPDEVIPIHGSGVIGTDGLIYVGGWSAVVVLESNRAPPDSMDFPIVRFDRMGTIVDTAGVERLYLVPGRTGGGDPTGPVRSFRQTDLALDPGPPSDTPLRSRLVDALIEVDRSVTAGVPGAATFTVTRIDLSNDTVYHRRFRYSPRAFTTSFVDELSLARPGIPFPPHQPPVTEMQTGPDGTVYLRGETDTASRPRWIVLAPDGSPLGRVTLPPGTSIRWVGGRSLYTVETDDLDVPWLVRYRLDR